MGNRLRTTYYTRKVCTTIPGTDNLQEYNMVSYITLGNKRYVRYSHEDWYLDMVMNAEGYTKFDYGDEFYPFYYIKDHLGNIRETYVRTSTNSKYIAQRMQYYPSGLPWNTNLNASEQPFKYGSKEFVEMHGLDEYDSEARWYYPAIMRTTTMDPMCEKYYSTSPYAWCSNNPVNYIDPDGRLVQLQDSASIDVLLNTINSSDREYMHINNDGFVEMDLEYASITQSNNYKALAELVKSETLYTVKTGSSVIYKNENGEIITTPMLPVVIEPDWGEDVYGFDTNETGWLGVTQTPGNEAEKYNSPDNNVHVTINASLSARGKALILSHELFGHALLYNRGLPHKHDVHNIDGKQIEQNILLRITICTSIAETKRNIRRK